MTEDFRKVTEKASGNWGVVAQFVDEDKPFFDVNSSQRFYAASLAKVPIAMAVMKLIKDGQAELSEELELDKAVKMPGTGVLNLLHNGLKISLQDALNTMMAQSDNTAAKLLVKKFGVSAINEFLSSIGMKITQLEPQPDGKFHYGDTTPSETATLLRGLYTGQFLGNADSQMILEIMKHCHLNWGIERYLPSTMPDGKTKLEVSNKEGTWEDNRHEVALVWAQRPYVLCVLSSGLSDQRYHVDNVGVLTIAQISKLIYETTHAA